MQIEIFRPATLAVALFCAPFVVFTAYVVWLVVPAVVSQVVPAVVSQVVPAVVSQVVSAVVQSDTKSSN
jgi:hypothetical protein